MTVASESDSVRTQEGGADVQGSYSGCRCMDEVKRDFEMKIWYVVYSHPYEYVGLIGTFTSKEKARAAIEADIIADVGCNRGLADYIITESVLDEATYLYWY